MTNATPIVTGFKHGSLQGNLPSTIQKTSLTGDTNTIVSFQLQAEVLHNTSEEKTESVEALFGQNGSGTPPPSETNIEMHHPVVLDGFHRKSLLAQNGQPLSSRYTPENPVAAQMSNVPSTIPSHTQGSNEMESSTKLNIEAKPLLSNLQTNHAFNTAQVAEGQSNSLSTHSTTSMDKVQGSSEWASVKVDPQGNKWGQQMLQVLHDRVSFQAQQNLQEAKIRLDPPELGKLDLIVRVEGDRLNVQLNASSMATREALIQVSERLRAELQDQNFVHVDVNVGSERDQQAQSEHQNSEDSPHIHSAHSQSSERHDKTQSDHWLNTHA